MTWTRRSAGMLRRDHRARRVSRRTALSTMPASDGCSGWSIPSARSRKRWRLFWHNHFATGYSKLAGDINRVQAVKMLSLKAGELPGPQGQLELFRQYALGNFRNMLIDVARDPAMVVWLDGRTNFRRQPQENFGREIMELFTFGVGNYTEEDVYAAARVFTGWNLRRATDLPNRDPQAITSSSTTRTSTTRRPRRSRFRSTAAIGGRFPRGRRPTACRTASISSPRLQAIRNGAPTGAKAVELFRQ